MKKKSVIIAFAVNSNGRFEEKHFSNTDKFLIYEWTNNELFFIKEENNVFKNSDVDQGNVSSEKCESISASLKEGDVKVLVSKQFGKNIQMVNHIFIPVIVSSESPDEVVSILKKHIRWIEDELSSNPEEYKLFTIKNGILKTTIKKDSRI
jgi:predicted Fe-Mo cluster-binding NifX family protein